MRRITSACLLQTMKFDTANDANPEQELKIYISKLDSKKIKYVIEEQNKEADGSIVLKIRKQYTTYETNGYIE
jgi:hypothetical protein